MSSNTKISAIQPIFTIANKVNIFGENKKGIVIGNFSVSESKTHGLRSCILPLTNEVDLDDDKEWKFTDGFYGILTLVIVTLAPFSVTLLPVNNVLTNPEYWYEILFSTTSLYFFLACSTAIEILFLLDGIVKKGTLLVSIDLFLAPKVTEALGIIICHLICSEILGYNEPIPYRYHATSYVALVIYLARVWYLIPKQSRIDPQIRKRGTAVIFYYLWSSIVTLQLLAITNLLGKVPRNVQWIVALIIPLTKEINDRIINVAMVRVAASRNLIESQFIGKIMINVMYSYCLAIALASQATKTTEYLLLGINFLIDMILCYKAIRLDRTASDNQCDVSEKQIMKKQILTELILNEVVEVVVPIAVIGSFGIAYYGPNKNILGNVGCTVWHYKKIEDLQAFLMPVAEMALIDSGSVILAAIGLWRYCSINLWKEYCKTIKRYWIFLALRGATMISLYFGRYLISGAYDPTGEFLWIRNDQNRTKFLARFLLDASNKTLE